MPQEKESFDMFDLTGKNALVTGATGGIGGAIAKALHGQGASVAISGTKAEKLEALASELGERVFVLPCDLRDRPAVEQLADTAEKTLGQVDILVNNAGITHDNLFMRMKNEEWDDVIAVNLTSVFVLTRGILRGMMRRRGGRIVNIASISGVFGNPGQGNYAASKAGLVGMTKSLAREVAARGITANCVSPGFISTPMTDALTEKQVEAIAAAIPAQTFGKPEDIAAAVVFFASDEAAYVTGETMHVNGGMIMV
jgi:3-oxoacyl-[acyl-carrier protein] reductase